MRHKIARDDSTSGNWLSDAAGALNRDQFCAINGLCNKLHAMHGVELTVVTLPGAVSQIEERGFATQLFNQWGVGYVRPSNLNLPLNL